ncbi:uncharacterized protein [Parasteatoda tepidariorum]|uniref:uncharacterized protein n=1 Tax=Parasteatoda tepidariorum TaxID=114398 RepID=UPI001C72063C|nr:uncharacterized protein LOC107452975 [Parasteatoda tepidariorum]
MNAAVVFGIIALALQRADAQQSMTCNFESDTCGFTNEENHSAQWDRKELTLGGKKAFMMTLETNETNTQMGRMITPYFELEEKIPGCLKVEYYFSGDGAKSFNIQQETEFGIHPIYVKGPHQTYNTWQKSTIDVDIDESLRFFFSAIVDPSLGEYTVAIRYVELLLTKCP